MNTIAKNIINEVKNTKTLLNWDGEFSVEDMIENIKSRVHTFAGWDLLSVVMDGNLLRIDAKARDGREEQLLVYNVANGREVYGRLTQLGLSGFSHELRLLAK